MNKNNILSNLIMINVLKKLFPCCYTKDDKSEQPDFDYIWAYNMMLRKYILKRRCWIWNIMIHINNKDKFMSHIKNCSSKKYN